MSKSRVYAQKFKRLLDFIDLNIDGDLSLDILSDVVSVSKYHFHRQFSAYCGVSVGKYVQLMRLKRASFRLVFKVQDRIIDIALDCGFENPESFSRAFKNIFDQTPMEFRKNPDWRRWHDIYQFPKRMKAQEMTLHVDIVTFEPTKIAVLEHRGARETVNDTAKKFIEWRKGSRLSPVETSRTFGIVHNNPDTTEPEDFRFDVCGETRSDVPPNPQGVITKTVPGGRCAVVRHTGPHDGLGDVAYFLYRDWLPNSGEELRDFPLFFHYRNFVHEVPECDLVTDVYLPIV